MRVGELIEQLQKEDPQTQIVVSADEEGNRFHKLADLGAGFTPNVDDWEMEIYGQEDIKTEPDIKESFEAGQLEEVLIIWP